MFQLSKDTERESHTSEPTNLRRLVFPSRPKGVFEGNCYIVSTVECAAILLEDLDKAFDNGFYTDHESLDNRLVAFVLESDAIEYGRKLFRGTRFAVIHIQTSPFRRWDLVMEMTKRMGDKEYDFVVFEQDGKQWMKETTGKESLRGAVTMRTLSGR